MFLAILFSVSFIYSFHVKCWSVKNPKGLDRTLRIGPFFLYFIVTDYKFGRSRIISSHAHVIILSCVNDNKMVIQVGLLLCISYD